MTTKRIVYTRQDGGVSVVCPAAGAKLASETEDQFVARIAAKDVPASIPFQIVDVADLPQDRRWRNAWMIDGAKVAVDLTAARKVRLAELERERDLLKETVVKNHALATATGDDVKANAAKKKAQDLLALTKESLQTGIDALKDLNAIDKHEPKAIKGAK